jgi:hypothetical protein
MARIRSIKPSFWDSEDVGKCSLRGRLLYIAMWNLADDYGIGDATPIRMLSFAFPNDDLAVSEIPTLCEEIAERFNVVFYTHAGRRYYYIPSWDEHQRTEKKAKQRVPYPKTPGTTPAAPETSEAPTSSGGSSDVGSRKKEVGNTSSRDADAQRGTEMFEIFWDTYDKKRGKKAAEQKYRTALKKPGVTHELLVEAARQYVTWQKSEGKHPEFTKDPATWLNGEHWNDERASRAAASDSDASTSSALSPEEVARRLDEILEEPPDTDDMEVLRAWRDERNARIKARRAGGAQ